MSEIIALKIFNQYPSYVEVDIATGIYIEKQIDIKSSSIKFNGLSVLIENQFIGLYSYKGKMILQIADRQWDIETDDIKIVYNHLEKGFTRFELLHNNSSEYKNEYISWWNMQSEKILPGFNSPPDEEEDFFAYIKMVWGDGEMRHNLLDIWERLGA